MLLLRGFKIIYYLNDVLLPVGMVRSLVFPEVAVDVTLFEVEFILVTLPLSSG